MSSVFSVFLVAVMGLLGGIPTIYILCSLFMCVAQKVSRKAKYGCSLYD